MTIAATRTAELDIDGICRQAFRHAGLANPYTVISNELMGDAREKLELITKGLAVEGLLEKVQTFENVTLATSDSDYSLNAGTLDVIGKAGIDDDNAVVSPISREELLILQQTSETEGVPSSYYVDRSASPLTLHVWPTPSSAENGHVLKLQVHRLRADSTTGSDTPDVEVYWQQYLVWELAHSLAVSAGRDASSCSYLHKRAEDLLAKCKPQANPRAPSRVTLDMRTNWSR